MRTLYCPYCDDSLMAPTMHLDWMPVWQCRACGAWDPVTGAMPPEERGTMEHTSTYQEMWDAAVSQTAASFREDYPGQPLDPEWSETGFGDMASALVESLGKTWRDFHAEVQAALDS